MTAGTNFLFNQPPKITSERLKYFRDKFRYESDASREVVSLERKSCRLQDHRSRFHIHPSLSCSPLSTPRPAINEQALEFFLRAEKLTATMTTCHNRKVRCRKWDHKKSRFNIWLKYKFFAIFELLIENFIQNFQSDGKLEIQFIFRYL